MKQQPPETVIHHLSDIHVGPLHYKSNRKLAFVEDYRTGWNNLGKYVANLRRLKTSDKRLPDLIVISGDFTSYGTEAEFHRVQDEMESICDIMRSDSRTWRKKEHPCLFIVPGNHDLDWSKETYEAKIERFARLSDSLPYAVSPISRKDRPPYYDFYPEAKLLIYLFNSCVLGGTRDPEIIKVFNKLKEGGLTEEQHASYLSELDSIARRDPGFIHPQQLEKVVQQSRDDSNKRLRIAVMHHNPSSVPSEDIEAFDTIINAGPVKETLLREGFDIILHGHRHFSHCSYEEHFEPLDHEQESDSAELFTRLPYQQGLFILSGDTQGSKEGATFYELRMFDLSVVHGPQPPATLVEVLTAESSTGRYKSSVKYRLVVGRPTTASMKYIQERLERQVHEEPELVRTTLNVIAPSFRRLQSAIDDWGESSSWHDNFAEFLSFYKTIYGVDLIGPTAWLNPAYLQYLALQFGERQRRWGHSSPAQLRFGPELHEAVTRTGWAKGDERGDPTILQDGTDSEDLEIARILLWHTEAAKERTTLEMIDSFHRLFGIPVFVLSPQDLTENEGVEEFVLAKDKKNKLHCFCFDLKRDASTKRVGLVDAKRFEERFVRFLRHPALMTIAQFLNTRPESDKPRKSGKVSLQV